LKEEIIVMNKRLIKPTIWAIYLFLLLTTSVLAGTAQYTYDNLNRLVQVQYDDGTTIQYSYDAAGNRLSKQVTAPQAFAPATGQDSGFLAEYTLGQRLPFSTWWGPIWGTWGESPLTTRLPK
jgi:YD repeat-containing protein